MKARPAAFRDDPEAVPIENSVRAAAAAPAFIAPLLAGAIALAIAFSVAEAAGRPAAEAARRVAANPAAGAAEGAGPNAGIARVAWIAGCWERASAEFTTEEQWMTPRAGTMLGVSRTAGGDSLIEFEFLAIREDGGRLVYEARPSGQEPARFLSTAVSDSSILFENPGHDFPQRIGYRLAGPDSLCAWIEGTAGGRTRRVEFPFRRASCPGR